MLRRLMYALFGAGWNQHAAVRMDALTHTLQVISYPHHEIHGGSSFLSDIVDESMGDDDTLILAFKTPPGSKRIHLLIEASTLVGGDVVLWENPSWASESGSLNPIINRNRQATMDSSILLEDQAQAAFTASDNLVGNPTDWSTVEATELHHVYAWGLNNRAVAGAARDVNEWILKPGTKYGIIFTADGGSNKAQVILNWYEHTTKDS